jgi:hypothetical protein
VVAVWSLLVAVAVAASGPRLSLPPGADPAAWATAAELAGFTLADAGEPATVELRDEGGAWSLRVAGRVVPVPPPETSEAREDTLRLARSLLRRMASAPPAPPVSPAPPTPPPPPVAVARPSAPRPARPAAPPPPPEPLVSAGPPEAEAVEVLPEEPEVLPDDVAFVALERVEPTAPRKGAPLGGWARAGAGLAVRASFQPGAIVSAGGGLASRAWAGGLDVSFTPRRDVAIFDGDEGLRAIDLRAGAWWAPPGRVAPFVGLLAGASSRVWLTGDQTWASTWMPLVAAEAGLRWRPEEPLGLAVFARAEDDLSATFVALGDSEARWLSPWQGQLTAVLTVGR